jgi:hypothetical protein
MIVERLEYDYPIVALRCHELVEAAHEFLVVGGRKIAAQSAQVPREAAYVRTLPDYYAKLHTVTGLPVIFLRVTAAVWAATDDIDRGLWAIDVVEAAIRCALDPVAAAAVEAGIAASVEDDEPDPATYEQSVVDGVQLITAAAFDTAYSLITK